MTDEQKQIIVEQEIDKSQSFLSEAYKLIEMEMWNVSANRAYYALYHAILALMIHDGYAPRTHSGLITEFGKSAIMMYSTQPIKSKSPQLFQMCAS